MTYNTRFMLLLIANAAAVLTMLKYLVASGIDIQNTTFLNNAEDLGFLFDFLSYLSIVFVLNLAILSYPSRRHLLIKRAIKMANQPKPINKKGVKNGIGGKIKAA